MSSLPSPVKSPANQVQPCVGVTPCIHNELSKEWPVEDRTHQEPSFGLNLPKSILPSPSKSPCNSPGKTVQPAAGSGEPYRSKDFAPLGNTQSVPLPGK